MASLLIIWLLTQALGQQVSSVQSAAGKEDSSYQTFCLNDEDQADVDYYYNEHEYNANSTDSTDTIVNGESGSVSEVSQKLQETASNLTVTSLEENNKNGNPKWKVNKKTVPDCCFKTLRIRLNSRLIINIQKTSNICPVPGYVVTIRSGTKVCIDYNAIWLRPILKRIQQQGTR